MHISTDESSRVGNPPFITVAAPGVQGATVAGMQGMGVKTPKAAAVAAATMGFEGVIHTPKGMIFTSGAKSMMVAAGIPDVITVGSDVTFRGLGATPNGHMSRAPVHTCMGIERTS
jgi:hypothetical protein